MNEPSVSLKDRKIYYQLNDSQFMEKDSAVCGYILFAIGEV